MTGVLEDGQVYSGHAGKKELDVSDVRLAVQTRVDHSFTTPPPRDVRACLPSPYTLIGPTHTHNRSYSHNIASKASLPTGSKGQIFHLIYIYISERR